MSKVFGSRRSQVFLRRYVWMQGGPSELNCARPRKTEKQDRRNQLLWPRGPRCFKLSGCRKEGPGTHIPSSSLNTCEKRKWICTKLIPHETSSLERRFPTAPRKLVPTCQSQQSKASHGGRRPSLLLLLRAGAFGGAPASSHPQLQGRGKAQV